MLKLLQGWRQRKKGDFLLDQSKDGTTQVLHTWGFYFAFLPCLHSTVLLSFPWTRLLAYFALPLLSHCHWNTKNPTQPCVLSQTVWPPSSGSLHCLAVFANRISSYSTTEPVPILNDHRPLWKVKHPRPKINRWSIIHTWSAKENSYYFLFSIFFIYALLVMCFEHVWYSRQVPPTFLAVSRSMGIPLLFICGPFGLLESACAAACDMKEWRKSEGRGKSYGWGKVWEEPEGEREGGRGGEGHWRSWITMAGVQGWLIVSDTLQFWGLYQHCFYSCN